MHERFEEDFEFGGDVPSSAPCPVELYEGDDDDAGDPIPDSVVLCNEDSLRILSLPSAVIIKL